MEVEEDEEIDEDLFATVMGYLTVEPAGQENSKSSAEKKHAFGKSPASSLSLDDFVTITFPLIDLEKQAEIAQVYLLKHGPTLMYKADKVSDLLRHALLASPLPACLSI